MIKYLLRILVSRIESMSQSHRLVLKSNIQSLFASQCRGMCKKKPLRDMIGPADPISNLHPIKYAVRENETATEMELRKGREDLQKWNELFWTKHNLSFVQEKKEFQENELKKKGASRESLSADEMSVFYKDFLDKNWKTHLSYLLEWYKRNARVTFLHFRVLIEKALKR